MSGQVGRIADRTDTGRYPRTIEDGAGSRLTFLGHAHDERGERLDVVSHVAPGHGPPPHVHHLQEEAIVVREGRLAWSVDGGPEQIAERGERVVFAPGVSHRFWNAGDEELVCEGSVRPPDNFEWFLSEVYASTRANGGRRPGTLDGAFLLTRYRSEFEMTAIPVPVRRVVMPLQAAIGRLLGRYGHFAGAPQPRRA
jgi:quercetin dioxygenase-like cupin family protein